MSNHRDFNAVVWAGKIHDYQKGRRMWGVTEKVFNKTDYPENLNQKIDGQHSKPCLQELILTPKQTNKKINSVPQQVHVGNISTFSIPHGPILYHKKAHLVMQVAASQLDNL